MHTSTAPPTATPISRPPALAQEQLDPETGHGDDDEEATGDVDHPLPRAARAAALVQVVEHGDEACCSMSTV